MSVEMVGQWIGRGLLTHAPHVVPSIVEISFPQILPA